jgi:protein-tyrosine phosphatase
MPADRHVTVPAPARAAAFKIYRICLVCLGNICRSPMAEILIRAELDRVGLADRVSVESAGTGDWHLGQLMDRQARAELVRRGYDGSAHRARQITPDWLGRFDLLLAMDADNLWSLRQMAGLGRGTAEQDDIAARIRLLREFDPAAPDGAEVPDPYGGSPEEFAAVADIIQPAARGLASALAELLGERAAGT